MKSMLGHLLHIYLKNNNPLLTGCEILKRAHIVNTHLFSHSVIHTLPHTFAIFIRGTPDI